MSAFVDLDEPGEPRRALASTQQAVMSEAQDFPFTAPADGPTAGPEDWIVDAFDRLNPDPDEARRLAAAAVAAADPDSSLGGRARHALGMAECVLGRIAEGRACLQEATETLKRHGPPLAACRAWRDHASVLTMLSGDVQAGVAAFEQALSLAETLADPVEEGAVLARMGPALGRAGRKADAERVLERAIMLLSDGPDRSALATAMSNLGYQLIQEGRDARALEILRQELPLRDPTTERVHRVNCECNLAVALAGTGQAEEALALIAAIPTRLNPEREPYNWADYLLSAGSVCLRLNDPASARGYLVRALEAARTHQLHSVEIDALSQLSTAEERCGDLAAALASERALRTAERQWLDESTAARVRSMQSSIELAEKRAENQALARARAELEQRVDERTAALHDQMRERDAAQRLARFWSDHDWLTRLPNRRQMQAALEAGLAQAQARGTLIGVLFLDLDGFKSVNDAHGHLVGDRLLRLTSRRLRRHVPEGTLVTRFGGDEFVVLLPDLADPAAAVSVAQALRTAVLAPLKIEGRAIRLSCSVGVAIGPRDASLPAELLQRADRAMLEAKLGGRNQVRELDASGQHRLERRGRLRRELGHAIENDGLTAFFQPLWDPRQHRLAGVELLARWHDSELGHVSPADFIPVAEESGQIGALGLWAVREAVRAAHALHGAGLWHDDGGMRVSVNLSTVQLADPMLVERLVQAVADAGGQPGWLELELTESVQLAEDPACQQRLRRLRDAGFTLAIDDFGAGYSSFSYLNRVYFDRLKIDRALVQASGQASDRAAVTGSIILMAHRLGLQVVAEGIETAEQIRLLAEQDCDLVQGYHIARPMPLADLLRWPCSRAQPRPAARG
jgi:diguanylate cyclase (GGDEF)-like protein